jgi:hypothetical protein
MSSPCWAQQTRFNARINPVPLLLRVFSANLEFSPWQSPKTSFGLFGDYGEGNSSDIYYRVAKIGLRTDIALTSDDIFRDGWYLAPQISYFDSRVSSHDVDKYSKADFSHRSIDLGALIGYGWFWNTGFNIKLGAGATVALWQTGASALVKKDGGKETPPWWLNRKLFAVLPAGEFTVGWTF